jgi:hypothetical protein
MAMTVAIMTGNVAVNRAVGTFYVHRHTGQILRILRVGRLGYQVLVGGLGRFFLSQRALDDSYEKAAVRLPANRRYLTERTRVDGALTLTLRPIRYGHELLVECVESKRGGRMRFVEAAQALYWFERLHSFAEFRALVDIGHRE